MNFKTLFVSAMTGISLLCATPQAQAEVNEKPFTVPELRQWKGGEGRFTPAAGARIVVPKNAAEAERIAREFSQDYTTMSGSELPVVTDGKIRKGDIALQIKPNRKANPESYTLQVRPDGVSITAPATEGLIWGTRTLLQLAELSEDGSLAVGTAQDYPEYGWRGFMLDAGRKYIPMDYIRQLVDVMAYYKMNRLHIHLNDNGFKYYFDDDWDKTPAAFRLESERYPGLTARDGSYTKEEFKELQRYAASKGVEIIAEIDFPAHALAFTRLMPEIGSVDGEYGRDHLDLMKPETYDFLDNLLDEYLGGDDPVITGPRFHIGTDEYSNRDSVVVEKFRYLTDRYIRTTENYGKQACVWGSLTHAKGEQPVKSDDVLMYAWSTGYANPVDMINLGYHLISIPDGYTYIVPSAGYYYDYLNTPYLYENWTPANVGGKFVLEGDQLNNLEGGMFALWNDHPNNGITVKDIHHRIMHALPVMASKTWDGAAVTVPYEQFSARAAQLSEAPGVNYLGRYGTEPTTVLSQDVVLPGSTLSVPEIGYDYTVEFDLEGAPEAKGTKLFESPNATFWISDPVTGNMAFSREDKLYTFRQNVLPGEKLHVKVTGNNKGTKLYVNDRLVDDMNIRWFSYNGKNKMAEVRTLVFPLQQAGKFNSRLTNLTVTNHID